MENQQQTLTALPCPSPCRHILQLYEDEDVDENANFERKQC